MCGVVGLYCYGNSLRVDEGVLTRMRDTMIHRGPDGGENWISDDRRVGLGHRRLSIIDLSTSASQPMPNEDHTVWVTYNGEIYNHVGLRKELVAAGHTFRTDHSDTEILVHGYEEWGIEGLLQRIEGDYAVGLWDVRKEKLFLFRDRIGVKPLYFSLQDGAILFASEIKAIVAHPAVKRDVDPVAMYHYLSFLTTPAPMTMFKGIFKLPAGHVAEVGRDGAFSARRYWDALPGKGGIDTAAMAKQPWPAREEAYIAGIRKKLTDAVEKRMMSDVPFGVFLSGGIDSSTNVALMSRYMDRPVDTFTVGFKDHKHLNELDEATLVAREFKTNHHEVLIDESDMRGYLGDLIHHQDEPIADWVCIPLYFVSKLAKDSGVTVVQVGEGSDEQFCGYASYMGYLDLYKKYWQPFRTYVPSPLQKVAAGMFGAAATFKPGLAMYADIVDRASRNREHFWSGATVFPESVKAKMIAVSELGTSVPDALTASGLMPASYLQPDTFNIIKSFNRTIDASHPGQDVLTRMIYNEFKLRLPELLLMRVDKVAMSVSIEARVPFLDHHLVDYTMDIPMDDKVHGGVAKHLLKKAVEGIIPHEIIYRRKMGFGAPMSQWMRGDFGQQVSSEIMSSRLLDRGWLDRSFIANLINDHRAGRRDTSLYIWTLYNLTAWYDYWIDGARA